MMNSCIEYFDQFGALFQLKIFNQNHQFKSVYGGLVSLLIYISITVYTAYIMYMWQTKAIPPTVVSNTIYQPKGMYLNMTSNLFTLSIENDYATDALHKIENKGKLYTVEGTYYGMNNAVKPMKLNPDGYSCKIKKDYVDFFDPICLNPNDHGIFHLLFKEQTWLYGDSTRLNDVYFEYFVTFCEHSTNSDCLNKKQAEVFMTEDTTWRLTTITQDVNLQTGEITDIPTDYYFPIKDTRPVYIQLKITKALLKIDDGILFPNVREIEIVKDMGIQFTQDPETPNSGPHVLVSLQKYQVEIEIRFVRLGEILANVSSLLQTLLLLGYLLNKINSDMLQQKIKESLLLIYFPQSRNYKMVYDWRSNLKYVKREGQILDPSQLRQFIDFRTTIFKALDLQFNHLHLLTQINKMQLAIQMLFPRRLVRQLRDVDYSIKMDAISGSYQKLKQKSNGVLDEEDFLTFQLLSTGDSRVYPQLEDPCTPSDATSDVQIDELIEKVSIRMGQNMPQNLSSHTSHLQVQAID